LAIPQGLFRKGPKAPQNQEQKLQAQCIDGYFRSTGLANKVSPRGRRGGIIVKEEERIEDEDLYSSPPHKRVIQDEDD
jgi:hypothetical protein